MYSHIDFKGLKSSALFDYAAEVPFFKGRKKLAFKPGLNILFGPNGCGKSTVLNILGTTLCATQGGISVVTQDVISNTVDMFATMRRDSEGKRQKMTDKVGLHVSHDGQPVLFSDPRKAVGLSGGAFDDDFFDQGIQEAMSRGRRSHGQQVAQRGNTPLSVLLGKAKLPQTIDYRMKKEHVNDVWGDAIDIVTERLKGDLPKGQFSVLLDEPESNFSLVWQARLWKLLADPAVAKDFQVIVASHSPFALNIGHAHYIDFEPGYRDEVTGLLQRQFAAAPTSQD